MSQAPPLRALTADCDVLIIGGGPAGSTVAALLARLGRDVNSPEHAHTSKIEFADAWDKTRRCAPPRTGATRRAWRRRREHLQGAAKALQ